MKLVLRFILAAMLVCLPFGADAQDVITGPRKPKKQTTAPAKKTPKKSSVSSSRRNVDESQLTPQQMFERGERIYNSINGDNAEAVKWYRKAAERGHARAQNSLGHMYRQGYGVEQSDSEAVKWFRMSAEQGDTWGQTNLGMMYQDGRGVPRDLNEARRWYQKAADQGYDVARQKLEKLK